VAGFEEIRGAERDLEGIVSSKGFEKLAWVLELDRKACSRPASKRFEELEWTLEVKLEGIIEAVLEEHREAGEDPGAGSRTHS
jgi:hypothetical protein